MRGHLCRQLSVRLVNVSVSGFLLACDEPLPNGTAGNLRVSIDGTQCHSPALLGRVVTLQGSSNRCLLAGRFSRRDLLGSDSLCGAVATGGHADRPSQSPAHRRWRKNGHRRKPDMADLHRWGLLIGDQ